MWIEAKKRRNRSESLFVFQFDSQEEDFEPYVEHLTEIVPQLMQPRAEERMLSLIEHLKARCDDKYADDEVEVSSFLFADEMAEFTTHMSYLLRCMN